MGKNKVITEAVEKDVKNQNLTVYNLVEGEIYIYDNRAIVKYNKTHKNIPSLYISSNKYMHYDAWFFILDFKDATIEQKKWLNACIKQNKFIEKSELDKYDDEGNLIKKKDFTNCKIWIGDNPELCRKVQEKLFELGYTWVCNDNKISYLDASYLVIWRDGGITHGSPNKNYFDEREEKEIFPEDLGIDSNLYKRKSSESSLVKEWSVGSYVVFLKDYGSHKKGSIDIIKEEHSDFIATTFSFNFMGSNCCLLKNTECKWFQTLKEAEEFSRKLKSDNNNDTHDDEEDSSIPENSIECEHCGGEGYRMVGKLYPTGHHEVWETCNECNGEGCIYKKELIEPNEEDFKVSTDGVEQNISKVECYINSIDFETPSPLSWIREDCPKLSNILCSNKDSINSRIYPITQFGVIEPNKYNYKYYEPENEPTVYIWRFRRESIKYSDL